jgi:hypothetical protein
VKDLSKPDDLPSDVMEGAALRGNEYGWSIISFPVALDRAKAHGYACLGGQFQFRLGDGSTCEMYWLSADSKERLPGEQWADYSPPLMFRGEAEFSALDLGNGFRQRSSVLEPPTCRYRKSCFVAYFVTESDLARLEALKLS